MILSVCVPTYNRSTELVRLLNSITISEHVEVVICDDGSTDNTKNIVEDFNKDLNISYIYQENSGVSSAIKNAYENSRGEFLIKMDSDDVFVNSGVETIINAIKEYPDYLAFVFGTTISRNGVVENNIPPSLNCNFISLRADYNIKCDLKEVVHRDVIMKYMYNVPPETRRVPPSLLWVKIAEDYTCRSFNKAVAQKEYLPLGITSNILKIKTKYSEPMVELYFRLSNSKVYSSQPYRWRSRLLWSRYAFHSNLYHIKFWWQLCLFVPGYLLYRYDLYKISKL